MKIKRWVSGADGFDFQSCSDISQVYDMIENIMDCEHDLSFLKSIEFIGEDGKIYKGTLLFALSSEDPIAN